MLSTVWRKCLPRNLVLKRNGTNILMTDLQSLCLLRDAFGCSRVTGINRRSEVLTALAEESWGTLLFYLFKSFPEVCKITQENPAGKKQGYSFCSSLISFQFFWQMNSIFFHFVLFSTLLSLSFKMQNSYTF